MFNILIYKKAQGDFSIGIPCLNDTNQCHPGWNGYLDKYDLFNFVGLKKQVGLRKKILQRLLGRWILTLLDRGGLQPQS